MMSSVKAGINRENKSPAYDQYIGLLKQAKASRDVHVHLGLVSLIWDLLEALRKMGH